MKVMIVNHYAIPPRETGGTRHFSLARYLVQDGHAVTIVASHFHHAAGGEVSLSSDAAWGREMISGVDFLWLRTPKYHGNTLARLWNMLVFAWRVSSRASSEQPDIIVGSSPHPFAALAALLVARRNHVPFVLEMRDLWPQTLIDLGKVPAYHPLVLLLGRIERYLYASSAMIFTLLPGSIEHITRKGGTAPKIHWLPNAADLSLVPAWQAVPATQDGVFTVMYTGAHGIANGLDSILECAKIIQSAFGTERVRFRLIGDGPEKARLQNRAASEGIQIVQFEGPVPKHQVFEIMQEADAFIVTLKNSDLYKWGMSLNKLFDYLAVGRPIVFGASTPWNPVSEANAGIVVLPEDPFGMAEAIKHLCAASPEDRTRMGRAGREYVEKEHSYEKRSGQLTRLLIACLERKDHQ